MVAQQLRAIGINAKQVPLERSLMLEKVYKEYDFDIHIHNYTTYGDPGVGVARVYVCGNIRPAPFANVSRYCNPKLDELFRQEINAILTREVDDSKIGFATITGVETQPDLRHAKVTVSVIGPPDQRRRSASARFR